ncbi:hypothetical protein F511_45937 [Dorcoceras hygrometricum]|uniref:Uncharacterized protein n=1 Tax=Dorcoceras hygrometricum TaxID=472368 RepID=A0A2Z6ZVA2_9LAMI|nr:hypothetical protein F511_45937 [Dorcoceras hygrometricum]
MSGGAPTLAPVRRASCTLAAQGRAPLRAHARWRSATASRLGRALRRASAVLFVAPRPRSSSRLGRTSRSPRPRLSRPSAALVAHVGRPPVAPGCATSRKDGAAGRWLADAKTPAAAHVGRWLRAGRVMRHAMRCGGGARLFAPRLISLVAAAAGRSPLRRVSGDVVTAGLILSRVWFGPVPGSP